MNIQLPVVPTRHVIAVWVAFAFGVLVTLGVMTKCGGLDRSGSSSSGHARMESRASRRIDTIRVPVQVAGVDASLPMRRYAVVLPSGVTRHDSLELMRLVAQRDSLATLLEIARVRLPFRGDTIFTQSGDTASVDCDELLKVARLQVRFAQRSVDVPRITDSVVTTITDIRLPSWAVTIGIGPSYNPMTNTMSPVTINLSISKPLFGINP